MASPFSWSDTVQIAFGSCLPCLKKTSSSEEEPENQNPTMNRIPRARPDELQGLLADPDTDVEAETLSLHSNPGRQRNRNKKKRRAKQNDHGNRRGITLFGYDLFGHAAPPPPIQLPDDVDDALYPDSGDASRRRGIATPKSVTTAHSTASTFDSDAAPLDSEAIAAMSSPSAIEAAAHAAAETEAQRLKEKEERRKRRREKKELKRVAEALARQGVVGDGEGEDFEGFQGSGPTNSGYPRIRNMFPGPTSDSGSGSAFSGSTRDDFGHFVSAPPPPGPYVPPTQDDEDEAADLDGGMYARRPPRGGPAAERSGEGSDSRSRTSASMSDRAHQFPDPRNVLAHLQARAHLNSPSQPQSKSEPGEQQHKRAKKSKSTSSRTTRSHSSTTTSQSPSLASPSLPSFPAEVQEVVSPSTIEQGQGFFDLEDDHLPVRNNASVSQADIPKTNTGFPTTRIGGGGFPMTGFGGGGARKTRDFGAFLARRGDDEDVDGLEHSSR